MIGEVSWSKLGFIKVSLYSLSQGTCGVPKNQICVLFIRSQKLIIKTEQGSEPREATGFPSPDNILIPQRGFFNILNARSKYVM